MLISSTSSVFALPYQAAYAASKSFLSALGNSIRHELKGSCLSLTVVCPAGVATDMTLSFGLAGDIKPGSPLLMTAERCAQLCIRAMVRRRGRVFLGFLNFMTTIGDRILPKDLSSWFFGLYYAKMLRKQEEKKNVEAAARK